MYIVPSQFLKIKNLFFYLKSLILLSVTKTLILLIVYWEIRSNGDFKAKDYFKKIFTNFVFHTHLNETLTILPLRIRYNGVILSTFTPFPHLLLPHCRLFYTLIFTNARIHPFSRLYIFIFIPSLSLLFPPQNNLLLVHSSNQRTPYFFF